MSVEEFFVGFDSHFDKISMLSMDDELKEHLLLKQANFKSHERNLVDGALEEDCSL